jgi:hypothetical protein
VRTNAPRPPVAPSQWLSRLRTEGVRRRLLARQRTRAREGGRCGSAPSGPPQRSSSRAACPLQVNGMPDATGPAPRTGPSAVRRAESVEARPPSRSMPTVPDCSVVQAPVPLITSLPAAGAGDTLRGRRRCQKTSRPTHRASRPTDVTAVAGSSTKVVAAVRHVCEDGASTTVVHGARWACAVVTVRQR